MRYRSFSSRETKALGASFGRRTIREGLGRRARVFALSGELGSGKTTFVQGFFRGLGLRKRPTSPTFVIVRRAPMRGKPFTNVFHLDAYRLKAARDLRAAGFEGAVGDPRNIVLIEWAERVRRAVPRGAIRLFFRHGKGERERIIEAR